jgi:hypothetical protein
MKVINQPVTAYATHLILTIEERDRLIAALANALDYWSTESRNHEVLQGAWKALTDSVPK